jgi:brefeldin A-inhibited guanine nucleotide-exchange protein
MEIFAERYTEQNPKVFPTADTAFILAFSIIMLNTDLHNPAIKEERRMTKEGFIRNNRGICDGQDLPEELLSSIFDRIKVDPISLKEDDEARERTGDSKVKEKASVPAALSPAVFFSNHFEEIDRTRESNFQKERDQIVRTTELLLKRKRHKGEGNGGKSNRRVARSRSVKFVRTEDSGLRDEYVSPMFEAAWGPALAAFSTAMESANGTVGALIAIATDEELELAAENAAETIEVCLQGFRLAICTAGLCGNETARDAYLLALSSFSQLGTGVFLEARHIRCVQTMLNIARDDGELLGAGWEHVFRCLSEVNRFHQLFHLMARNDRAAAAAEERRRRNLEERQRRREARESRLSSASSDDGDSVGDDRSVAMSDTSDSMVESELFSDDDFYFLDDEMDKRAIDEANARAVYEAVSESLIEAIYERSSTLSGPSIKEFILQLCRVSRMEISGYGGHVGSQANTVDLTQVHYRQHHTLLHNSMHGPSDKLHRNQPNIYNLQKLVEVTHYNMESRPRLVFAEIWTTVSAHLTSTALHSNAAVAMYAVDSFRQLSIHCLQREELGVFEFQRRFLKPFEIIMSKSEHVTTKEFLLNCVDRIILMFGSNFDDETAETSVPANGHAQEEHIGTLRSGWRPVLAVLGLAGQDPDEGIAKAGFKMLTGQLRQCLSVEKGEDGINKPRASFLLGERFIDLIDALLKYVSGPHEELSLASVDHLVTLSSFLSEKTFALELVKRRSSSAQSISPKVGDDSSENLELELWWPILLGLSRSIEDQRKGVRLKCLVTLFGIVNQHFFPSEADASNSEGTTTDPASPSGDLQTVQLIFRGILTPVLEFAEISVGRGASPPLPEDFDRFPETPKQNKTRPTDGRGESTSWLDTTFDHFMDGCVSLCLHSIDTLKSDSLVEEVFAMLNNCLLSESGSLAVRGIRRLEQFLTSDLNPSMITDDTWATSSHMLRRCLFVRGLPKFSTSSDKLDGATGLDPERGEDFEESVLEFVREDSFLLDRRYVGSTATMVIGSLLLSDRFSSALGLRWRLFLITGLARAIREWERAEGIIASQASGKVFDPTV